MSNGGEGFFDALFQAFGIGTTTPQTSQPDSTDWVGEMERVMRELRELDLQDLVQRGASTREVAEVRSQIEEVESHSNGNYMSAEEELKDLRILWEKVQRQIQERVDRLDQLKEELESRRQFAQDEPEMDESEDIQGLVTLATAKIHSALQSPTDTALASVEEAVKAVQTKLDEAKIALEGRIATLLELQEDLETHQAENLRGADGPEVGEVATLIKQATAALSERLKAPTISGVLVAEAAVKAVGAMVGEVRKRIDARVLRLNQLMKEMDELDLLQASRTGVMENELEPVVMASVKANDLIVAFSTDTKAPTIVLVEETEVAIEGLRKAIQAMERSVNERREQLEGFDNELNVRLAKVAKPFQEVVRRKVNDSTEMGNFLEAKACAAAGQTTAGPVAEYLRLVLDKADEMEKAETKKAGQNTVKQIGSDLTLHLDEMSQTFPGIKETLTAQHKDKTDTFNLLRKTAFEDPSEQNLSNLVASDRDVRDGIAAILQAARDKAAARKKIEDLCELLEKWTEECQQFLINCQNLASKAGTDWSKIPDGFLSQEVRDEFLSDKITAEKAEAFANDMISKSKLAADVIATALEAEQLPNETVVEGYRLLLSTILPDIEPARKRTLKNANSFTMDGLKSKVLNLANEAGIDENKQLSSERANQIVAAFARGPCSLTEVENMIAAAVTAQHNPRLGEWLKVLNMTGKNVRVEKLGSIEMTKSVAIPVHITLYISNVDVLPSVHATADNILEAILPPGENRFGTHVTLELFGEKDAKRNPHYFRYGEFVRVEAAREAYPNADWVKIEKDMKDLLQKKIDFLRDTLVVPFKNRLGRHMSDRRAG